MKTRNVNTTTETTVKQSGGCCGSTPVKVEPVKSSCCGPAPKVKETPQTGGGCC
ncbi:hypothetical protein [Tenacibaculum sp. 190524A02b]|uniref:Uncharacterized protein n=1 Tax=Tenacibaculum vairaonense TaxID=3137860 RepID=A0ABP1FDE6_9FLAO